MEERGARVCACRGSAAAGAGKQSAEPICSRRRRRAEAGTFVLASPLAGGGVQCRTGPPAAGFAQWSPAADVGQPGAGLSVRGVMAVDITLLFRASVKTVKTRNKALGVAVGGGVDGSRDELFRRSPRPKGDFSSRAREVVSWLLWKRRAGGGLGPATWTPEPDQTLSHKRV